MKTYQQHTSNQNHQHQQIENGAEKRKRLAEAEPHCHGCGSTGAYILWHKINKTTHAFKCNCKIGEILRPTYPSIPYSTKNYISYSKRNITEEVKEKIAK